MQTKLFIGGAFVDAVAGTTIAVLNPHDGSTIAEIAEARAADVDAAVAAARAAFPAWSRMAAADRGRLLLKLADRIEQEGEALAQLESRDTGHPLRDTRGLDVPRTAATFRYFGGMADKLQGSVVPVETGFLITPWAVVVALTAPLAGRLSDRHPPGLLGGCGLALLCLGMLSFALMPMDAQAPGIVLRMAVCGIGFGFFQSPNLKALMSSAPPQRSGGASGIIGMARLIGQTSGAALVALCLGLAGAQGAGWALALGAGFAALASAVSFGRLRVH